MNLLGFGSRPVDIVFTLRGDDPSRAVKRVKVGDQFFKLPVYLDKDDVVGKVDISLKKTGSRLEHQGIRIEFIGQVETAVDRPSVHEFVALSKLLAYPGELSSPNTSLDFSFIDAEKPHESYYGHNIRLRYLIRLTIIKRFGNVSSEEDIFVKRYTTAAELPSHKISMEVGIEDSLHIEFEYLKSSFHLKDVIVGRILFSLVRIKIKYLELNLTRRETIGAPGSNFSDSEVIAKYEILDGAPLKGDTIPIRFFLAPYELTPTMRDIVQKFSVNYALNLILVDEEDRRYFKQQDIFLWRRTESEFIKSSESVHQIPSPSSQIDKIHIDAHDENPVGSSFPKPNENGTLDLNDNGEANGKMEINEHDGV